MMRGGAPMTGTLQELETERIFEFLARLNYDLDDVWGRILSRRPLPSTREVFSKMRREERRRVMLKKTLPTGLDVYLHYSKGSVNELGPKQNRGRPWCDHC